MIVELLSVLAVLAGGSLLVRTTGLTGWSVPAFGLVAGVCLELAIGTVQAVTPLPVWPALTLALTAGLPAAWWGVRWRRGHDVSLPAGWAGVTVAGVAVAVVVLRAANLVKWHSDSLRYLMAGQLLADGGYDTAMSTHDLTKRLLGVPLLHAPAHLAGEDYLRSVTALLAVATVAIMVWLFHRGGAQRLDPTQVAVFATLGVLLLVTNNRFVFSAFYLNGHLLTAVLLLVIAGCGWLLVTGQESRSVPAPALLTLPLVAIPALVVTRPEGPLLAGVALLPALLAGRMPVRHRVAALATLGASTLAWHGYALRIHLERGADPPLTVVGMLGFGVVVLLLAAGLPRLDRWLDRWLRHPVRLLWAAEAGLWLALAAFAVRKPDILADSLRATAQNVVVGAGKWGTSLVVLGVLVLAAALLGRVPGAAALRFPVTTFIPLAYLMAYLRDAPFRVGYGDSLSRMFMHIVPLAVLYVIVTYAHADLLEGLKAWWTRLAPPRRDEPEEAVR
jgi:hypothetical protein